MLSGANWVKLMHDTHCRAPEQIVSDFVFGAEITEDVSRTPMGKSITGSTRAFVVSHG